MIAPAAVEIDSYVIDVLMRDLVGHDRTPAAFVVYLYLAARIEREMTRGVAVSLGRIAAATGLSKTAVQGAVAHLKERELIAVSKPSETSTPIYSLKRHWRRRLRNT
ncbi:MAG: helix-turn-helix domain-containing protein [Candidatus Acidiferrales bacterium]